jgi:hypothetical protein
MNSEDRVWLGAQIAPPGLIYARNAKR